MKRSKVYAAILAAGAVAGVVVPGNVANAAPGGNGGGPSCAALWARSLHSGGVPGPLGLGNQYLYRGFAADIARTKLSDGSGYCAD